MQQRARLLTALLLTLPLAGALAAQKTVVCIDNQGDGFLNNSEGWFRSQLKAGDLLEVGDGKAASFGRTLRKLKSGDTLVVVVHGVQIDDGLTGAVVDTGFKWGGKTYRSFGGGFGQMPLPAGLDQLDGVKVDFSACYSAQDVDGAGAEKSILKQLLDELGPGATGSGYTGLVQAQIGFKVAGGSSEQIDAALRCLTKDGSWLGLPPANHPSATPNQQTQAQAVVDACPGAGGNPKVTLEYFKPSASGVPDGSPTACAPSQDCGLACAVFTLDPHIGACCLPDGSCELRSPQVCAELAGAYQGDQVRCVHVQCSAPALGPCGWSSYGYPSPLHAGIDLRGDGETAAGGVFLAVSTQAPGPLVFTAFATRSDRVPLLGGELLVDLSSLLFVGVDAVGGGVAVHALQVPLAPALRGATLYCQSAAPPSGAGSAWSLSNGLAVRLCP